jgi:hypothetical protein
MFGIGTRSLWAFTMRRNRRSRCAGLRGHPGRPSERPAVPAAACRDTALGDGGLPRRSLRAAGFQWRVGPEQRRDGAAGRSLWLRVKLRAVRLGCGLQPSLD